jgi:hypothetical protein
LNKNNNNKINQNLTKPLSKNNIINNDEKQFILKTDNFNKKSNTITAKQKLTYANKSKQINNYKKNIFAHLKFNTLKNINNKLQKSQLIIKDNYMSDLAYKSYKSLLKTNKFTGLIINQFTNFKKDFNKNINVLNFLKEFNKFKTPKILSINKYENSSNLIIKKLNNILNYYNIIQLFTSKINYNKITFKNFLKIINNYSINLLNYYVLNIPEQKMDLPKKLFKFESKLSILNKYTYLGFLPIKKNIFKSKSYKLYNNFSNYYFSDSKLLKYISKDKSLLFKNKIFNNLNSITKIIWYNNFKNKYSIYTDLFNYYNNCLIEYKTIINYSLNFNIKNIYFYQTKNKTSKYLSKKWESIYIINKLLNLGIINQFFNIVNYNYRSMLNSYANIIKEFLFYTNSYQKKINYLFYIKNKLINVNIPRFSILLNDKSKINNVYFKIINSNNLKLLIPNYYANFLKRCGLFIKKILYNIIYNKWIIELNYLEEQILKLKLWFLYLEKEKNKYNPYRKLSYSFNSLSFSRNELNTKFLQRIKDIYFYSLYALIFQNKLNIINNYSFNKNKSILFFNNNYNNLFEDSFKFIFKTNNNLKLIINKTDLDFNFNYFENKYNKTNLFINYFNKLYINVVYHIFNEYKNKINQINNLIKGSDYIEFSNIHKINNYFNTYLNQLNNNSLLKSYFIVGPKFLVATKKEITYNNDFNKNQKLLYNLIYSDLKYHDQWNDLFKLKKQWIYNYTLKGNIVIYDINNTLNIFSYIDNYQLIRWFLNKFSSFKIVNQVYNYNYFSNNKNSNNLPIKFINNSLNNVFNYLSCLISRPIYNIYNDKISIDLFFYINKFSVFYINLLTKNKININTSIFKIYSRKLKLLNSINYKGKKEYLNYISKIKPLKNLKISILKSWKFIYTLNKLILFLGLIANKPVEINLTRMLYPYKNANILAKFIALNSKKFDFSKMIFRIILDSEIMNPLTMKFFHTFAYPLWYADNDQILSFLGGINIRKAGRLITQKVIPRITVYTKFLGTFSRNKIIFYDFARFTSLHKRGIVCVTVNISHFIVD